MPTVSIFLLRNTWCLWFEVGVQLHSFTIGYPVVPAPLVEKTVILLGTWFGSSVSENETHEHGEISTRLFTSAEGRRYPKKCTLQTKDPPLFIPNAGDVPVPFPWVRSGHTFFPVG